MTMAMAMAMAMDLYGHLFSDAPWRAMELMPELADYVLTIPADEDRSDPSPRAASAS